MFGLFSCENDPNVVLPEKENEPYVYSDSILDVCQKEYDEELLILNVLQRDVKFKMDSLLFQIDVQLTVEDNQVRFEF